jgi:hypothetical protein
VNAHGDRKCCPGSWWLLLVLSWLAADLARAQPATPAPAQAAPQASTPAPSDGAASTDIERARALFKQGVELARDRDFANAAARFREALALHEAPAVQYNLAAALSHLREHAEAFNLCQQVMRNAAAPADVQEHSRKLSEQIMPSTARLTVLASAGGGTPEIAVDGEPLPGALLGVVRAVAPGTHTVTAEREQQRFFERAVTIPSGTAAIVDVSLIVSESVIVQKELVEVTRAPDPVADDHGSSRKRRRRLWSGIAAGLVAVGAGVAVALVLSKPGAQTEAPVSGTLTPGVLTWK